MTQNTGQIREFNTDILFLIFSDNLYYLLKCIKFSVKKQNIRKSGKTKTGKVREKSENFFSPELHRPHISLFISVTVSLNKGKDMKQNFSLQISHSLSIVEFKKKTAMEKYFWPFPHK